MKIIKTAPRIPGKSAEILAETFSSLNAGAEYVLSAWPSLYRNTLDKLRGQFSRGELMLMIDVFNSTALTAMAAGQQLDIQVDDGMRLDALDEKWGVDRNALNNKIADLTIFEAACLEIWANGFWYGGDPDKKDLDIEAHVVSML